MEALIGTKRSMELLVKKKVCVGFLREEESTGEGGSPILRLLLRVQHTLSVYMRYSRPMDTFQLWGWGWNWPDGFLYHVPCNHIVGIFQ